MGVVAIGALEYNHFTPERVRLLTAIIDGLGTLLANSRLARRLEASTEEMAVVDEVARIITSNLDIDQVYEQFAAKARSLIDFDRAAINEIDENTGTLYLRYLTDSPGSRFSRGDSIPLEGSLSGQLADGKRTKIMDVPTEIVGFSRSNDLLEEGYQSIIATPLLSKEVVIGTFILFSKQAKSYGFREKTLLERLASQIAPAVENSRLYRDLQASIEEMAAVDEVARIITSMLGMEEVYEQFASEVKMLIDVDQIRISMIDESKDILHLSYVALNPSVSFDRRETVPLEGTFSGHVAKTRETLIINDLAKENTFWTARPLVEDGLKSAITVPLVSKDKLVGTLVVLSAEAHAYGLREQRILDRLAAQIAPAVENSRLYRDLQASIEEMAAVDEVARVITSTLDIEEVYEQFASEVKMLMDVDQIWISMIDESKDVLHLSYGVALNPSTSFYRRQIIPLEGTFSGHVANARETLIINDLAKENTFWPAPLLIEDGLSNTITVPLISKDKLIGTLSVLSAESHAYGLREQVIVERLASQIAPSVEISLLFQEAEQMTLALESIGEGVAFLDLENKFKYVNRVFAQLYGYNTEEVLGKSGAIVVPADEENQAAAHQAWAEGNTSGWRGELKRVRKDGHEIDVFVTITPLKNKEGEVIGRIGVARDITDRKRAQERLQETARLSSIGELAAGVAHEINNPLTSVLGFSQLLMSEDLPPAVRSDLEIVHSEAARAAKIVHNLLSFARRPEPTKMYMEVNLVLHRAIDMKSYNFQVSNIRVVRDFSTDLPNTMADEQQLIQVFLNILNNAEQAMSRHRGRGLLTVRTMTTGTAIKVSINDNGPGIPAGDLPRIFEPFFTTKAVGEGTGLGLSVSYGIVSQHGGDIWADSSAGEGTTFYVEIPVTSDEVVESPKPAASQGPISEIKRVLVVDDEPTIRALLSRSLELDGLKVDLAGDGEEAWRRLQTHPYDCIILDLKMPGMSGQQLYQAIGALGQELTKKVIFITGDTVSSETLDFIAEAGSPALTKPVDLDQLRQWVRSSLEPAGRSA